MTYRTNMIPAGIQNTLLKELYENGCYFLSIIHTAEKNSAYLSVDVIRFAIECIDNKWLKTDFTVIRPDKILERLIDKEVSVISVSRKEKDLLQTMEYKAVVNCWYNPKTGLYHFNTDDWDSLVNSKTVKEGYIISYRVFNWN